MRAADDLLAKRLKAISTAKPPVCAPSPVRPGGPQRVAREERKATYRLGRIVLGDRSEIPCIIRDVSSGGARVVLEGAIVLPERVVLKTEQTGERRRARVAWQSEREAGLSFAVEPAFKRGAV